MTRKSRNKSTPVRLSRDCRAKLAESRMRSRTGSTAQIVRRFVRQQDLGTYADRGIQPDHTARPVHVQLDPATYRRIAATARAHKQTIEYVLLQYLPGDQ